MYFLQVLLITFISKSFGSFFDWPLGSKVQPIHRRLQDGKLKQAFQAKSLNFDRHFHKVSGVADDHSIMYFDRSWADWKQNTLLNNIKDSYLPPWSEISVSTIKNPIKSPAVDDPYDQIFINRRYTPKGSTKKSEDDFKIGPAEYIDGQLYFVF